MIRLTHAERCDDFLERLIRTGLLYELQSRVKKPPTAECATCGKTFAPKQHAQNCCSRACRNATKVKPDQSEIDLQAQADDRRLEPAHRDQARLSLLLRRIARDRYGSYSAASAVFGKQATWFSHTTTPCRHKRRSQVRNLAIIAEHFGVADQIAPSSPVANAAHSPQDCPGSIPSTLDEYRVAGDPPMASKVPSVRSKP